jgi:hypothetical protein
MLETRNLVDRSLHDVAVFGFVAIGAIQAGSADGAMTG